MSLSDPSSTLNDNLEQIANTYYQKSLKLEYMLKHCLSYTKSLLQAIPHKNMPCFPTDQFVKLEPILTEIKCSDILSIKLKNSALEVHKLQQDLQLSISQRNSINTQLRSSATALIEAQKQIKYLEQSLLSSKQTSTSLKQSLTSASASKRDILLHASRYKSRISSLEQDNKTKSLEIASLRQQLSELKQSTTPVPPHFSIVTPPRAEFNRTLRPHCYSSSPPPVFPSPSSCTQCKRLECQIVALQSSISKKDRLCQQFSTQLSMSRSKVTELTQSLRQKKLPFSNAVVQTDFILSQSNRPELETELRKKIQHVNESSMTLDAIIRAFRRKPSSSGERIIASRIDDVVETINSSSPDQTKYAQQLLKVVETLKESSDVRRVLESKLNS
ncbi:hypothetical protein GEMRC1_002968 [Eukaryota sp. GEM-RC1]